MNREELVKGLRDKAEEKLGEKVSKVTAKAYLEAIEEVIHEVIQNDDSVIVGGIKVYTKEKEAETGVLGGKPWSTGRRSIPKVKLTDTAKKKLTKELD